MSENLEEFASKDFTNPEDIFDFSARPSLDEQDCFITHYIAALNYSKLPRKLTAEPCVRLSDLQAMNDYKNTNQQHVRIDCANCGSGFIYPSQPAECHAGKKLYYCPNCKASFSRQADRTCSHHVPCHQTDKLHCCICGQVYQDLARFIYHCQSHDEREYHKVCANKQTEPHTAVAPPALLAIPRNEFSNDGVGYASDEVNILIENNPIYSPNSVFSMADYSTDSQLPLYSYNVPPNHSNQIVDYNRMLDHNLHQHYLKMRLLQAKN